MGYNPYSAPTAPIAPGLPTDETDLYIETLPNAAVRVAGIAAVLTGVVMLFCCMRFLLSGAEGFVVLGLEATFVLVALAEFAVGWGVTGGRTPFVILGFVAAPLVGILSLFVLVTGALIGMFGGSLALLDLVLLGLAFSKVRRMAIARAEMKRQGGPSAVDAHAV
jgi:hypothetical protein